MKTGILTIALLASIPTAGRAQTTELIPRLERLAATGNSEALYHLGMAYHTGSGVVRNEQLALGYFRRAAEGGDPLASFKLGCFYEGQDGVLPPDLDKALTYNLVAARAGYALAQQDVGALYAGHGDKTAARSWLAKAAAQGWPDALMAYAAINNDKTDVTADPVLTSAYFQLFLLTTTPSAKQQDWLATFQRQLTPEQRAKATVIVSNYRPEPTALTIKALSGQRAAEALVQAAQQKGPPRKPERP